MKSIKRYKNSQVPLCLTQKLYNPREPLLKVGLVQVFHRQYPLAFFPLTNHVPVASCSNAAIRAMFRFLVRLDSSLLLNKTLLCRFFATFQPYHSGEENQAC